MTKTRIEIEHGNRQRGLLSRVGVFHAIGVFIIGVSSGVLIQTGLLHDFPPTLLTGGSSAQLAAVADALDQDSRTTFDGTEGIDGSATINPDDAEALPEDSIDMTAVDGVLPAPLLVPDPALTEVRLNELNTDITAHAERIAKLNTEIEYVRDASVALVAQFTQNCGNWKDDCAKPYADQLEIYNTSYDDMATELSRLTRELTPLRNERANLLVQ